MAAFDDPFDPDRTLHGCSCGHHRSQAEHDAAAAPPADAEQALSRAVQAGVMRALFPDDALRRRFLKSVGAGTALAAVSTFFPLGAATALALERGPLEKRELNIGFLPITCATPLVAADPLGFYAREGLTVSLMKTAGWAVVRDKTLAGEFDAAHMLSPMPLAISLGLGASPVPMVMPALENVNGNAITLGIQHKDKQDPKSWKGMRFAIPFDYSMHNFLLRHFLAAHGLDPDRDVQLRVMAPPDMVSNLRSGNIDGFIVAEPFNQRAVFDGVGYIHTLTSEIWDKHPCCAFAATARFAREQPNTFSALFRAIVTSTLHCSDMNNRKAVAEAIAGPNYLNQPATVLEQVLLGRFADGLGKVRNEPGRIDFDPFPWQSMAVWMLAQMKRWGYLKGEVDYRQVAEQVFLATDARKRMAELGYEVPASNYRKHIILGKTFDPERPEA
ncbi:nitrate ABC transporter substrate-binding protein [Azoarcus indigens]|uniref:Nitrate/nitrite transport system substrate-binding protein n=1 Tax=Azoarcus indigens TaxID=29545 RepID=A0A4R6EFQ5_9RHOO|nr:CmpA/NrtA family ABC transporter substrate-binding protein [Azoarcus indigens]NMG63572.1 nitrate ABC transporter substrate-binding protein [Azoarcus indigens]TDN57124.1 nitrate/nitrite transport system substrate-binding protein [Azoarcus indigens]